MACCGVRGKNRVKIVQRLFRNLSWLKQPATTAAKRRTLATLVVSRSQYQEHKRSYKVSLPDLYRVIQNECKMLNRPGCVVVWMVLPKNADSYDVQFAVIPRSLLASVPSQLQLVVPETWLFYRNLVANVLYQVNGEQNYWAFLSEAGSLHVTTQQGLMRNAHYFLEALGLSEASIERRRLELPDFFEKNELSLNWWQLAGLVCLPERSATPFQLNNYKAVGKWIAAVTVVYALLLSGALIMRESWLEQDVTELKQSASLLVDQQTRLDEQLLLISNYDKLFNNRISYGLLVTDLAAQLKDVAEIESLSVTDNLVTIRGKSKSATDALAKLADSGNWQESRFTQPVQSNEEGDIFTISTIYQPQKSGAAKKADTPVSEVKS